MRQRTNFTQRQQLIKNYIDRATDGGKPLMGPLNRKMSLFEYVYDEWGGLDSLINFSSVITSFAGRFYKNNTVYQTAIRTLKYGIPASLMVTKLVGSIKNYQEYINPKKDVNFEKEEKILQFLDMSSPNKRELSSIYVDFGKDVVNWLFQCPKTESFNVYGFYEYEKLEKVQNVYGIESGNLLIPITYKDKKYVWDFSFSKYLKDMLVHSTDIFCPQDSIIYIDDLKNAVFKEFLQHFDIKSNVLYFNGGLHSRKRLKITEDINQYDVNAFAEEVRKVLLRKKRRGYAFVGIPGVGKSSLIRKLESIITDYPFIYLTPHNFKNETDIISTFKTLTYMQPCIAVMEDLDSYGFHTKNERLGTFLDEVDDVNGDLQMALITTINDTNKVHYTLINRPGRLDQIILVKPPSIREDVYTVLKTKYTKEACTNNEVPKDFISYDDIDKELLDDVIKYKMTQADICEIIEKALYISYTITNDILKESLSYLINSKKAIAECNFKDHSPNEPINEVTCYGFDVPAPNNSRPVAVYRDNTDNSDEN